MNFVSKPGIYKITNKINNKIYIGSSYSISKRISEHKYQLRRNSHPNIYLQSSWNKYGEDNFEFSIVTYFEEYNKDILQNEEQTWIDYYDCANRENGYNLCPIAYTKAGYKMDEESRKNISNGLRKRFKDNPDAKNHISKLNKKLIEKYGTKVCIRTNKLSEQDVISIANMNKTEVNIQELAELYNVSISCIKDIFSGRRWSSITNIHYENIRKKLKREDILNIVDLYENNKLNPIQIANIYNTSSSNIRNILTGKTFSNITGIQKRFIPPSDTNNIHILQYDLNNVFIKEWNSLSQIEKENPDIKRKEVSKHCKTNEPYKWFIWKYK